MAKKQENLPTRITPASNVPSYLTQYQDDFAEQKAMMGEYVVTPRIKLVQAMSATELTGLYGVGSVILTPGNSLVAKNIDTERGELFSFTPLFFFTEFMKWKDYRDKGEGDMISERSFQRDGKLAALARDREKRLEPYGEIDQRTKQPKYNYRYVEHLNFVGVIQGEHPLTGQPAAFSFARGEFGTGRNLITGIMMRKTPMWSQVWNFNPQFKTRNENKWWGWSFTPPDENPNIAEDQVETFRNNYLELKQAFEDKRLSVDQSSADVEAEVADPNEKF